nr:13422_t:CDS:2 [Entrophospora candida]
MSEKKSKKKYSSAQDYKVLEDIEHIRKRPGNYIGSTDEQGWHHLFQEIIDNSIDEAVAGHCDQIKVTLSPDQRTITLEDNGYGVALETMDGVPLEKSSGEEKSVLLTLFSSLKSGGKFENKIYETSGGLHGIGVTAVNALSEELKVTDGFVVSFTPDPEIFKEFTYFKVEIIQKRLKELAYLNPNLTLYFYTSPTAEPIIYHFTGGLRSWIEEIHTGKTVLGEVFHKVVLEEKSPEYFQLDFAFQYQDGYDKINTRSFCNNIRTGGGGSHVSGFESGLFEICKELVIKDNPNLEIELNDVLTGLTSIVSVRVREPEFAGQTKDRLANREVREKTKKVTQELVSSFFQDNATTAKLIKEKVIDNAKLRLHLKEEQDIFQGGKKSLDLIKVLSGSEENEEIFFVEGKSAGGSAEEGRDVKTQTVLALQGKPPNALKLVRRVLQNKQIQNVLLALDEELTLPEEFVYEEEGEKKVIATDTPLNLEQITIIVRETLKDLLGKANFKKIILMADPDDDGAHIVILLVTFIFKHLPYLVEGGKLFVAVPPLYRVQSGKQIHYFYDDQELDVYRKKHPREERKIERIKGLGQMDASELFESTMDPSQRQYLEKRSYREASLTISEEQTIDMSHLALVNFLRYAYAVVEDRALPNVHDGLKPVQRRILFALYRLGITPNKSEVTSANIVGIYNALAHMARADKFRYPLVYGRGNFGYDKNPPAAMRYTKVNKGKEEPFILPTSLPNLLLNGSSGIAVGMTANIPPHHLGGTLTATVNLIRNPDLIAVQKLQKEVQEKNGQVTATDLKIEKVGTGELIEKELETLVEERKGMEESLLQLKRKINQSLVDDLQGPDFPTGGYVLEKEKLPSIYEKGEGTIYLRAKVQIFSPAEVIKSTLVARIAEVIKDKKIPGLKKIVDYSNRGITDIRLEFDSQQHDGQIILNKLYKSTQLQISFAVKMRALIGENPKVFSLMEVLQAFISNRLENIRRKSQFQWKENEKKLFDLEIRRFNIEHDEQISRIAKNRSFSSSIERRQELKSVLPAELQELQKRLSVVSSDSLDSSEKVSDPEQEVFNRIFRTMTSYDMFTPEKQAELVSKINDLKVENEELGQLAASEEKRKEKLIADLEQLKKDYEKDNRRTQIITDSHLIDERKAVTPEEIIVILSQGEKKKTKSKGEEEERKIYIIPVYKLTDKSFNLKESGIIKLTPGEVVEQIISVREDFLTEENKKEKYLVIGTKKGKVKRLPLEKIGKVMKGGKKVINISKHGDEIVQVSFTSGQDDIMVFTKQGKNKNFTEEKIRIFGRSAYGDTAIKLESGNQKVRCPKHRTLLEEHKTAPCCDKSRPGAQLSCPRMKEINMEIRKCFDCNRVVATASGQDEMVSLLVVEKEFPKNEFNLLAIREDKSGVKKALSSILELAKRKGGKGKNKFRVEEREVSKYCGKHENSIGKLRESWEVFGEKFKAEKKSWEELKEILDKAQKEQVNPEVIKKYEEELVQVKQKQQELKEKELKIQHESDKCCDKKKTEKEELKGKIEQLQATKPNSKKLEKLRAEFKELNKQSLKNRVECPRFQEINQAIRKCLECNKQKSKKAVKITPAYLQKVLLLSKREKSEIYLLAEEAVCRYNKKDLVDFLQDEKKKKIQLYKGQKVITSLNAYPVDIPISKQ